MNSKKVLALVILSLTLTTFLGSRIDLLPRVIPANALSCPTAGPSNACITVSLDANSKLTTTATASCAVPLGQQGVCDTTITTSASNRTTFRVGAILNATAAQHATSIINCGGPSQISCGVWGWQFAINYDPTIVTPQGDPGPTCAGYPDCGEKTVMFGSQTSAGAFNWAGALAAFTAGSTFFVRENVATHTGQILVGFTFVSGATPVVLSARTVLANVAFELVSKGTPTFTASDVIFVDDNTVPTPIAGITAAPTPTVGQTLSTDPKIKFVNATNTDTWSPGKTIIYDTNNNGIYDAGEPVLAYSAPAIGTRLLSDPKIKFVDVNGNGVWDGGQSAEPIIYDANSNNMYDAGELIATCTVLTCGAFSSIVTNDPPHASFVATQISAYAFTFDGSGSTDSDGTIADPGGYYWDFGDGTQLPAGGSLVINHDYSTSCPGGTCPNGNTLPGNFVVSLRVVDDGTATGSARDAFGKLIVNGQPSHISKSVLANQNPTASFTHLPLIPLPGATVTLDASTSTDDDIISSYSWNFGDGSLNGTGVLATHVFASAGTYNVTLALKDSFNGPGSISHLITVAAPPSINIAGPTTAQTGTSVIISLLPSTTNPGGSIASIKVDWGDGTVVNLAGTTSSATHTYSNSGNYNVTVTVTDNNGETASKSQSMSVTSPSPPPPQPSIPLAAIIGIPIAVIAAFGALLFLRRRRKSPQPTQQK